MLSWLVRGPCYTLIGQRTVLFSDWLDYPGLIGRMTQFCSVWSNGPILLERALFCSNWLVDHVFTLIGQMTAFFSDWLDGLILLFDRLDDPVLLSSVR